MIKLEVEIKDEKFNYSYEVGASKHHGSSDLCADTLALFTELLKFCSNHYKFKDKEWEREMLGKAYLEKQSKERTRE